ncbi:erythromycin esterase family protein [Herbaspirillum sp. RV1423]|uniref:erythromycin esterase family protein n=1 Tax=Herbaspirillum sp. RV1423 TaxID=1443993 RepID=UPI00054DADDC|nr:erythromycin esterase family protein [Herbaspirillum sp. RV1423]
MKSESISSAIRSSASILTGADTDYDSLLALIGEARFVLLGEASHGTQEFYRERARITQRLITERNFTAVAIEGDWPDAYRVNRYVRHRSEDKNAEQALGGFKRFPTWMWRNAEMLDFVDWLRDYNGTFMRQRPDVGLYGLDLYSLFTSIEEVLRYLDNVDPQAARRARERYACFDHFQKDSQTYGYAVGLGMSASCEEAVVTQLQDLRVQAGKYLQHDGADATDAFFYAQQNARLIADAEQYYRTMFSKRVSSWNLRDQHMMETLDALAQHLQHSLSEPAKIVVWAHNSHLGDARATDIGRLGEWNVGQLARQSYGEQVALIGFTTYRGTVTAASDWDAPAQRKRVRPALTGSYEELFHQTGIERFMLPLRGNDSLKDELSQPYLERAIGVIYLPETERQSHYFHANMPQQFDAILHFDETHAVKPLELSSHWETGEAPETFPVGL